MMPSSRFAGTGRIELEKIVDDLPLAGNALLATLNQIGYRKPIFDLLSFGHDLPLDARHLRLSNVAASVQTPKFSTGGVRAAFLMRSTMKPREFRRTRWTLP